MRTTKIMAFSVPPEFESEIQEHAQAEHRTISEYLREAVRQYMNLTEFRSTQKKVSKKIKAKKLRPSDVDDALDEVRRKA